MAAIKEIQISALTVNCSQLLIVLSAYIPHAHVSACLHVYMFTCLLYISTYDRQLTGPRPDLDSLFTCGTEKRGTNISC